MKAKLTQPVRATLLFGVALLATPAFAQQGQNVTPPPVVPTVPQTEIVTPPPTVQTAPASPIVQPVPDTPEPAAETAAEPAARTATRRTAARTETRTTRTTRTTTRAARAPAPRPAPVAPAEAPAPVAAPAQSTAEPVAAPAPAPVAAEAPAAAPAPATTGTAPIWPWLVGGALLALAALAFLLFRRRSEYDEVAETYYEEPVYEEPVSESIASQPIAVEPFAAAAVVPMTPRHEPEVEPRAPIADVEAEPVPAVVAAEGATVAEADSTDLAGMQAGSAPVPQRPWLELGMRPVRAGTMASEALVEVELIVGNAGDMRADNVRISTFMLPGGAATSEMEELLVERANDTTVSPMTIEPGEGKCVDATLAVSKSAMLAQGDSFSPMIVADARYTLPDGSEGRTSATFRLGLTDEDGNGMEPIGISHGMHENVVAELEGAPARA